MAYDFNTIASSYDRLNHIMTAGMDRLWRRRGVRWLMRGLVNPKTLDVAAGTGDLAVEICSCGAALPVVCVDLSEKMLAVAESKLSESGEYIVADAEHLPFQDCCFDCVASAFGIRNFLHLDRGLSEMARVLKIDGRLLILELSTPDSRFVRFFYNIYAHHIIPWLGSHIAGNREAYTYLPNSIERFPKGDAMLQKLESLGLRAEQRKFFFGVCRMYICVKR